MAKAGWRPLPKGSGASHPDLLKPHFTLVSSNSSKNNRDKEMDSLSINKQKTAAGCQSHKDATETRAPLHSPRKSQCYVRVIRHLIRRLLMSKISEIRFNVNAGMILPRICSGLEHGRKRNFLDPFSFHNYFSDPAYHCCIWKCQHSQSPGEPVWPAHIGFV